MSSMDIVDLCSDDDLGEVDVKPVKLEPNLVGRSIHQQQYDIDATQHKTHFRRQDSAETGHSGTSVLDQEQSPPVDDSTLCSISPICAAPLCRQFWKAGTYHYDGLPPKPTYQSTLVSNIVSSFFGGSGYLHIHPRFLHSNATSHKWAFGAIAELLDNAVDEIQNGATFVLIDKTSNPRNGNPALLIQDDGGGMDPEAMRHCMSFGFSDKKSKSAIGQYGNGFKTSTMRLGGDVIVFSRSMMNRKLTQSIGLLSYTFLTQAGYDRIVVPMVYYEFNQLTGTFHSLQNSTTNLSVLLQWSPYSTEEELLKQFEDVGAHGTKIIIYNLWFNDEGTMELDFESDPEDIRLAGKGKDNSWMAVSEQHIANHLHYSLRAYFSVLYLRVPETFCMYLRGRVVEYHNIATELKYPEFIVYKPQSAGSEEGQVLTTIGFLKEAPNVNVHGFNVYHKNRLILPFWHVVNMGGSRGRGVVGVLEANFIQPTHSKQDFEKTALFQKLEARLKEMTWEYWDYHCHLIGYQKKPRATLPSKGPSNFSYQHVPRPNIALRRSSSAVGNTKAAPAVGDLSYQEALPSNSLSGGPEESLPIFHSDSQEGARLKRKGPDQSKEPETVKRKAGSNLEIQPVILANQLEDQEAIIVVMQENKRLRAQCLDYEKTEEELNHKVNQLRRQLGEVQREYARLLAESQLLEKVKGGNNVLNPFPHFVPNSAL